MLRACFLIMLSGILLASVGISQEKGGGKKNDPPEKVEDSKERVKGFLPANWGKLGLSDDQRQKVYRIQNKYNDEIDKLEAQIKELKVKMSRERFDILTEAQKKRLREITEGKVEP